MRGDGTMGDKPYVVRIHDVHLDSDYRNWIAEIKERFQASQIKAVVKVNSEALLFNKIQQEFPHPL